MGAHRDAGAVTKCKRPGRIDAPQNKSFQLRYPIKNARTLIRACFCLVPSCNIRSPSEDYEAAGADR